MKIQRSLFLLFFLFLLGFTVAFPAEAQKTLQGTWKGNVREWYLIGSRQIQLTININSDIANATGVHLIKGTVTVTGLPCFAQGTFGDATDSAWIEGGGWGRLTIKGENFSTGVLTFEESTDLKQIQIIGGGMSGFIDGNQNYCFSADNSILTKGGIPPSGTPITPLRYKSSGYKYLAVSTGAYAGFESTSFDDTLFLAGIAPFGVTGSQCSLNSGTNIATTWPVGKDLLLRKRITLNAPLSSARVSVAVDNAAQVWINGVQISSGMKSRNGCPGAADFSFSIPSGLLRVGVNLIAVRARDNGGLRYIDAELSGVSEQSGNILIPYGSTNYRYSSVKHDGLKGIFERTSFDETRMFLGNAAFGSRGGTCALNNNGSVKTFWGSNSDLLIRKWFSLTTVVSTVRISLAVDNGAQVFVNGLDISGGMRMRNGCAAGGNFTFNVPVSDLRVGRNLVAVRARDTGGLTYFDMQVTK